MHEKAPLTYSEYNYTLKVRGALKRILERVRGMRPKVVHCLSLFFPRPYMVHRRD